MPREKKRKKKWKPSPLHSLFSSLSLFFAFIPFFYFTSSFRPSSQPLRKCRVIVGLWTWLSSQHKAFRKGQRLLNYSWTNKQTRNKKINKWDTEYSITPNKLMMTKRINKRSPIWTKQIESKCRTKRMQNAKIHNKRTTTEIATWLRHQQHHNSA